MTWKCMKLIIYVQFIIFYILLVQVFFLYKFSMMFWITFFRVNMLVIIGEQHLFSHLWSYRLVEDLFELTGESTNAVERVHDSYSQVPENIACPLAYLSESQT